MFIRCYGKVAATPYTMPYTGAKVYSLEELCYYIGNNIYTITEDFFTKSLVVWLRDEADQRVLSNKLETMITNKNKLKDLVVTILCACDYYKEHEIRELMRVIDDIVSLPLHEKSKIRADNYMRAGLYAKSAAAYRKLLTGAYAVNFTPEAYGNILHNLGIAQFYTASFEAAERDFKEAYARNHSAESLHHYLYLLLMQGRNQDFERECIEHGMNTAQLEAIRERFKDVKSKVQVRTIDDEEIDKYKEELRKAAGSAI
jgi:tetratricopeptide (TPR) repeat protein